MKISKTNVLKLSKIDEQIMNGLEKKGLLKASQLSKILSTSRQAISYRLRDLQMRGFVKFREDKGWEIGTYWKKEINEGNGFEIVVGLENIEDRLQKILNNNPAHEVHVIENIYYKLLSENEKIAWKKMDKIIDDIFVKKESLIRAVGNDESYKIFIESQEMHKDSIDTNRKIVYKIIPNEILRLPFEESCTICSVDDYIMHLYFKTETMEIVRSKVYSNLINKFYSLAEGYGKLTNLNTDLIKLKRNV